MKLKKYITIILATFVLGFSAFCDVPESATWSSEKLESEGFDFYTSTKSLELYLNKEKAIFAVRVIDSGYVWYSSPLDWDNDEFASGYNKNALASLLQVNTKDSKGSFYPSNSYMNAVSRGGFKVAREDDGFVLNHNFKRDGFFIPLHVSLEDDSLVVKIYFNEIEEEEEDPESTLGVLRLLDITLLPYFGAAPEGENGYIFVPDGSGAIIKFDNKKTNTVYSQYVYGRDKSIVPTMKKTVTEDIYLPVFGLSREDAGFIAVVEENKSNSIISASTAGQMTSYNNVTSKCIIRDIDTFSFRERTGTPRNISIFQTRDLPNSEEYYSVRYMFLNKDENSYVGMAEKYRKYLQEKDEFPQDKTDKNFSMALNFIGAGTKKKGVLGIPMKVNIPFTPFDSVTETVETLKDEGVDDFVVKFDGWMNGGIFGKYPSSPKPAKSLGGKKGFKNLISYLKDNFIDFYAGADFVNVYKSNLKHVKELSANRQINKSPAVIPDYRMSTFDEKTTGDTYPYWVTRLPFVKKFYDKFFRKFSKKYGNLGIAPDSLGNDVGSDFGKKGNSRDATAQGFEELLNKTAQTNSVLLSRPLDYGLASASYIMDVPVNSSDYDIENYAIPFYQIVIKGYIPFANLSANRALDKNSYILQLLETGSDISYLWITENQEELRDSRLQSYSFSYAPDWIDEAGETYREVKPILESVAGQKIVEHKVYDDGSRITVYENGVKILTNYSDKTASADGLTAQAYSYAVGRAN